MWIGNKSILLGSHLLSRVEVVDVPIGAAVENDDGTIRISVPESSGEVTWLMPLDQVGRRSEKEIQLLRLLLAKSEPLLTHHFDTKVAKLGVLHEAFGINFHELTRGKR